MWTSSIQPSLSTVTNTFISFLWAGANLTLRKFHFMAKRTQISSPEIVSSNAPTLPVWSFIWDWKKTPPENGWMEIKLPASIQTADRTRAVFLGGSAWCSRKGCKIKFSQVLLQTSYQSSKWGWLILNVKFEIKFMHLLKFSFSVSGC